MAKNITHDDCYTQILRTVFVFHADYFQHFKRGYFFDGKRRDAVPEVLYQMDSNRNGVLAPFLPVIGLTHIPPLPPSSPAE
jgi:hypothetical protein